MCNPYRVAFQERALVRTVKPLIPCGKRAPMKLQQRLACSLLILSTDS